MGIIVSDTFTEGADTNLDLHTPDVGQQWVEVAITGTTEIKIYSATDDIGGAASAAGNGQYLKSQPAPSSADVDVQITCSTIDGGTTNQRKFRLHARGTGATDYYAVRFVPPAASNNDTELVKVVASTLTSLASVDTGIVNGDVFLLEIRDAAKRVLKNGAQILTNADNAITGAGDCGLSMGQVSAGDVGNIAGAWRWDTYSVNEIVATTVAATMTPLSRLWGP